MKNYNKYLPQIDNAKKQEILDAVRPKPGDRFSAGYERQVLLGQAQKTWSKRGLKLIDTVYVGMFSCRELLEHLGIKTESLTEKQELAYVTGIANQSNAAYPLVYNVKDKKVAFSRAAANMLNKGLINVDFTKAALTRWDRFWGFFGIKTSHAKQIEPQNDFVEKMTRDLEKATKLANEKSRINEFLAANKATHKANEDFKLDCDDEMRVWNYVFTNTLPKNNSIRLSNGKSVSAAWVCLALCDDAVKEQIYSIDTGNIPENLQVHIDKAVSEFMEILKANNTALRDGPEAMEKFEENFINKLKNCTLPEPKPGKDYVLSTVLAMGRNEMRAANSTLAKTFPADDFEKSVLKNAQTVSRSLNIYDKLNKNDTLGAVDFYQSTIKKAPDELNVEEMLDYTEKSLAETALNLEKQVLVSVEMADEEIFYENSIN